MNPAGQVCSTATPRVAKARRDGVAPRRASRAGNTALFSHSPHLCVIWPRSRRAAASRTRAAASRPCAACASAPGDRRRRTVQLSRDCHTLCLHTPGRRGTQTPRRAPDGRPTADGPVRPRCLQLARPPCGRRARVARRATPALGRPRALPRVAARCAPRARDGPGLRGAPRPVRDASPAGNSQCAPGGGFTKAQAKRARRWCGTVLQEAGGRWEGKNGVR
jgi:hypothetical protein